MPRELARIDSAEAMKLLAGAPFGRVVFTAKALPAIRPVNHLVDNGDIIIRTHLGAAISHEVHRDDGVDAGVDTGVVVAYQVDDIDAKRRLGWSVVVTGVGRLVTDAGEIAKYSERLLPWLSGERRTVIRIHPEVVTGYRIVASPGDAGENGTGELGEVGGGQTDL